MVGFDEDKLTIGKAINTDKYGWKVKNYTVTTDEFTTGVWRLFYQDSNYAYLVTDECVGNYKPSDYYTNYTNGADVSTVGQKLNSQLLENGTFFTSENKNGNIRATAWLTDTSEVGMWNKYKNEDAVFAIRKPNSRIICSII